MSDILGDMVKKLIVAENAPAAVGPYSHAAKAGNMVYTAGQIALDPATMKIVDGGIEAQTRQVLDNLGAVLNAAGASLTNVLKTTVFLADINDYKAMNGVYAEYFGDSKPARSAFAVNALPLGALVEIEAVAVVDAPM